MKSLVISAIASLALLTTSCMENKSEKKATELQAIFPKGEKGAAENFTGNAWNTPLVANDSTYNTVVGNVYFEPGARSNWHTHPSGQILIITDGVGYHQIKGQPRQQSGKVMWCSVRLMYCIGMVQALIPVINRCISYPKQKTAS